MSGEWRRAGGVRLHAIKRARFLPHFRFHFFMMQKFLELYRSSWKKLNEKKQIIEKRQKHYVNIYKYRQFCVKLARNNPKIAYMVKIFFSLKY